MAKSEYRRRFLGFGAEAPTSIPTVDSAEKARLDELGSMTRRLSELFSAHEADNKDRFEDHEKRIAALEECCKKHEAAAKAAPATVAASAASATPAAPAASVATAASAAPATPAAPAAKSKAKAPSVSTAKTELKADGKTMALIKSNWRYRTKEDALLNAPWGIMEDEKAARKAAGKDGVVEEIWFCQTHDGPGYMIFQEP